METFCFIQNTPIVSHQSEFLRTLYTCIKSSLVIVLLHSGHPNGFSPDCQCVFLREYSNFLSVKTFCCNQSSKMAFHHCAFLREYLKLVAIMQDTQMASHQCGLIRAFSNGVSLKTCLLHSEQTNGFSPV